MLLFLIAFVLGVFFTALFFFAPQVLLLLGIIGACVFYALLLTTPSPTQKPVKIQRFDKRV